MNRRDFVKGAVATVPGIVALNMLNTRFAWADGSDFETDIDVLNYALTLEYLEAEFYRQGIAERLTSEGKETVYIEEIARNEQIHVSTLVQTIQTLGGTPVSAPAVFFAEAFASRTTFLSLAYTFENVGVSAYLGAAGFIESKEILTAAASIYGVECRHAAILGTLLEKPAEGGVYMGELEKPLTKAAVLEAVTPFLAGGSAMAGGAAATL